MVILSDGFPFIHGACSGVRLYGGAGDLSFANAASMSARRIFPNTWSPIRTSFSPIETNRAESVAREAHGGFVVEAYPAEIKDQFGALNDFPVPVSDSAPAYIPANCGWLSSMMHFSIDVVANGHPSASIACRASFCKPRRDSVNAGKATTDFALLAVQRWRRRPF